ncbi:hypothetical protein [Acidisoma sp. C75]
MAAAVVRRVAVAVVLRAVVFADLLALALALARVGAAALVDFAAARGLLAAVFAGAFLAGVFAATVLRLAGFAAVAVARFAGARRVGARIARAWACGAVAVSPALSFVTALNSLILINRFAIRLGPTVRACLIRLKESASPLRQSLVLASTGSVSSAL